MPDFIPDPEFEKKLQAAASAPLADPEFVNHLRGRLTAAQQPIHRGSLPMFNRTRIIAPALALLTLLVLAAFFLFQPVSTVSAQQILDRSAAAQSAAKPSSGIWRLRMQLIDNPLAGENTAVITYEDQYNDLSTAMNRTVTTDSAGNIIDLYANDGTYSYSAKRGVDGAVITPLSVVRTPLTEKQAPYDLTVVSQGIFNQFNDNPRVKVSENVTWTDGRQVYVLTLPNTQTQKSSDGQEEQTLTGETQAIFDANTYQILEYKTTILRDGKEILINSVTYLTNEILPDDAQITWNLSDLKNISIVDEPPDDQPEVAPQFKIISEHELAAVAQGYVLKNPPAGFELEIIMIPGQTPDSEPQNYEINYQEGNDTVLGMMWVGKLEPGFVDANFYDGSYQAASGLELHYSPSSHDNQSGSTNAMLVTPDGTGFLVRSALPRETVQTLVDDLTPIQ